MQKRQHPKAHCYRVLLVSRYYHDKTRRVWWWPTIAGDSEQDARERGLALFGGGTGQDWEDAQCPGLPLRADVAVVAVRFLHPTTFHDERGS